MICPQCSELMNVTYVFRKKKGKGRWQSIGHFCTKCGYVSIPKRIRLSQGVTATENLRKDERKRV